MVLRLLALLLVTLAALGGCGTMSYDALLLLEDDNIALRELQTRRFDTTDESMVLSSSAAVLQDLGFTLEDSETEVGLLFAVKERTAVEAGQVAGAVAATIVIATLAALMGANSGDVSVPWDERQHLRVCLVTRPVANGIAVRVTFQRFVWNNKGHLSKQESLQEREHYVEFFDRLSKAIFLEAHEL